MEQSNKLFRILLISLFYTCKFFFLLFLFPLLFYKLFLFMPADNMIYLKIRLSPTI